MCEKSVCNVDDKKNRKKKGSIVSDSRKKDSPLKANEHLSRPVRCWIDKYERTKAGDVTELGGNVRFETVPLETEFLQSRRSRYLGDPSRQGILIQMDVDYELMKEKWMQQE